MTNVLDLFPTSPRQHRDRGPQNRNWSIDLICRPDSIEATITHTPTNSRLTKRIDYAQYDDGTTWSREMEAHGDLFTWMAEAFSTVGHDDHDQRRQQRAALVARR